MIDYKAKFRRRTLRELNRMQMTKILCSNSLAFDAAHVKSAFYPRSAACSLQSAFYTDHSRSFLSSENFRSHLY